MKTVCRKALAVVLSLALGFVALYLQTNVAQAEAQDAIDSIDIVSGNPNPSIVTAGSEVMNIDEEGVIDEIFKTANLIDSTPGRASEETRKQVNYLFDHTTGTNSDFRTSNGGTGAWIAFDFGLTRKVQLDMVKLLARSDQTARANGIVIQGKNHWEYEPWTTITTAAVNTANWQTLTATSTTPYRFLRVYSSGAWFGNMDELKFYGNVADNEEAAELTSVSLLSDNPDDDGYALSGNHVTLSFTAEEPITGVNVTLADATVPAVSDDGLHWTATVPVTAAHQKGNVGFVIIYDNAPAVTATTDGSAVIIIDALAAAISGAESLQAGHYTRLSFRNFRQELDQVKEAMNEPGYSEIALVLQLEAAKAALQGVTALHEKLTITQAMVAASTAAWGGGADTAQNGWRAFDGNLTNAVDTTANPSWVRVDLGEGNGQIVETFRFYPRSTHVDRVNGSSLQGSNDGETWATLHTISGINTAVWHSATIQTPDSYRYYRYYAPIGNANVAELELIKPLRDRSLLQYYLEQAEGINPSLYTADSVAAVTLAAGKARELLSAGGYSQAQIDEAADAVETALNGLTATGPGPGPIDEADKTALLARIAAAEALLNKTVAGSKLGQYSPTVREGLEEAVEEADDIRTAQGALQETVDEAESELARLMLQYRDSIVTLVPGQTQLSIQDLSIIASYLGTNIGDEGWDEIEAADVLDKEKIDINTLVAVARMLLTSWLEDN